MNMTQNMRKKAVISIFAVFSVVVSIATPETAQAKSSQGLLAFLSDLVPSVNASEADDLPESGNRKPLKTIRVVATAYNSMPGQTDSTPCITANGHDLCQQYEEDGFGNTIAANGIAMGTHVRLPELFGDTVFVVRDRMNARYGYGRVDVWMPTIPKAKAFGVKRVAMEIF